MRSAVEMESIDPDIFFVGMLHSSVWYRIIVSFYVDFASPVHCCM